MTSLKNRLVQCFSLVFPELATAEIPGASRATTANWDSLANLSLITVLEEEFSLTVAEEAVVEFESFDRVYQYLQQRLPGDA